MTLNAQRRRWSVLVAAVLTQLCLGGIYAWSALVEPMKRQLGLSTTQTQLVFGVVFAAFTLSTLGTGRLLDRFSPRPVALTGGVLLSLGYTLAGFGGGAFAAILLGVGLLGGLAIGCGYPCALATPGRWFPSRVGLITGIVVAGYGGGAIVTTLLYEVLLSNNFNILDLLKSVGTVYGGLVLLCGLLLVNPPGFDGGGTVSFDRRSLLRDRRFWRMAVAFFCGNLPGLLVIGNLKPLGLSLGHSPALSAMAIAVLSAGNAGGRVFWGALADRLEPDRTVWVSMATILGAGSLMLLVGHRSTGFVLSALLTGLGFASCLVIHAARVPRVWGPELFGSVYGPLMLAHGAGALLGPPLGGLSRDLTGSYQAGIVASLVVAAVGLAAHRMTR